MAKTAGRSVALCAGKHSLSSQLREVIASRGLTAYGAGRLSGVDPGVVSRFLSGARDIRLGTADRLASALGLRLVEVGRPVRPRPVRPTLPGLALAEGGSEGDRRDVPSGS